MILKTDCLWGFEVAGLTIVSMDGDEERKRLRPGEWSAFYAAGRFVVGKAANCRGSPFTNRLQLRLTNIRVCKALLCKYLANEFKQAQATPRRVDIFSESNLLGTLRASSACVEGRFHHPPPGRQRSRAGFCNQIRLPKAGPVFRMAKCCSLSAMMRSLPPLGILNGVSPCYTTSPLLDRCTLLGCNRLPDPAKSLL